MLQTLNRITWILFATLILGVAAWGLYRYTENERRLNQLEREKTHLQQVVSRLTSQKRVAELMLTSRSVVDGVPAMKVLMVEYARDGQTAAAIREFELKGTELHIDARVLSFDRDFLFENDPLRGASVSLFTRIYGDKTAPDKAEPIDPEGQSPEIYRGADPSAAEFEARLWKDFWRLLEDSDYAKQHGVRIAQGEGLWWPPKEGKLYTVSVAADGGMELKSENVKAIYLEAMKKLIPSKK